MRDQRPMSEAAVEALVQGRHGDPFALLGPHREGEGWVIRALLPGARAVTALAPSGETLAAFRRVNGAGLFEAEISEPRIVGRWGAGRNAYADGAAHAGPFSGNHAQAVIVRGLQSRRSRWGVREGSPNLSPTP